MTPSAQHKSIVVACHYLCVPYLSTPFELTTMNGNSLTKNGALEMEPIHSEEEQPTQTPVQFLHSLSALIMAYASYYRGITASLLAACFILLVVISLDALTSHAHSKFHHLSKDYSSIPSLYELKMAHIDHWCLQVCFTIDGPIEMLLCVGIYVYVYSLILSYCCDFHREETMTANATIPPFHSVAKK